MRTDNPGGNMRSSWWLAALLVGVAQGQELYVVPDGVETRWASPENPRGERGKGATANAGRKAAARCGASG